jgi:DNA polymerase elongation subunit (family B)
LVVCRKGLWFNCAKFDIASLYPTIILAYRIHSRKDPLQIGLRYLKTYWEKRLLLKQIANETGDRSAQIKQSGLKVLTNSHYGHFGSKYKFNDINAAERVTEIGRKILTRMIAAVEDMGLLVVEADTDGIIVACQDRDPEEIRREISKAIPPVFKVELEWQGRVVFVSEKKNYMVFEPNGDLALVKGGKWRGRDKPAFQTKAIPEFVKRWFTEGVEAALEYARQILEEIQSGNGWRWVVCTRRVSVNDKSLQAAGFKVGEKATFAYKRKTSKAETTEIALKPEEGYDCKYYAGEFSKLVKEVIEAIDPAQIAAWERMVAAEARPLIFAG